MHIPHLKSMQHILWVFFHNFTEKNKAGNVKFMQNSNVFDFDKSNTEVK